MTYPYAAAPSNQAHSNPSVRQPPNRLSRSRSISSISAVALFIRVKASMVVLALASFQLQVADNRCQRPIVPRGRHAEEILELNFGADKIGVVNHD